MSWKVFWITLPPVQYSEDRRWSARWCRKDVVMDKYETNGKAVKVEINLKKKKACFSPDLWIRLAMITSHLHVRITMSHVRTFASLSSTFAHNIFFQRVVLVRLELSEPFSIPFRPPLLSPVAGKLCSTRPEMKPCERVERPSEKSECNLKHFLCLTTPCYRSVHLSLIHIYISHTHSLTLTIYLENSLPSKCKQNK